jgi:hypothetical protein
MPSNRASVVSAGVISLLTPRELDETIKSQFKKFAALSVPNVPSVVMVPCYIHVPCRREINR